MRKDGDYLDGFRYDGESYEKEKKDFIFDNKGYNKCNNNQLQTYIDSFLYRFKNSFEEHEKLTVSVWKYSTTIALFFTVNAKSLPTVTKEKQSKKQAFKRISKIEPNFKKNMKLKQKIEGFTTNGFYIIQPNYAILFNKNTGTFDSNNFMHAVLIEERESYGTN